MAPPLGSETDPQFDKRLPSDPSREGAELGRAESGVFA